MRPRRPPPAPTRAPPAPPEPARVEHWSPEGIPTCCIRCGRDTDRCIVRPRSVTWWCGCTGPRPGSAA
jgi:hypothetical protein